ncbi:hypothetical protein ANOBCDAF_01063 [Pleomorphomonas sp. T1.2MG-36]|uniref:hypothetical protein n=1 Tax=Pleomorphomonas sp. T1.2MG-36 TaxID=3041167 RepID=UPI002477634D|nr:hypothetical protein [Pleomorphomonas sp. T1.2MG-36]CAI9403192.1 hypothetical protein ANOBCDAF_01063 [Pleomorphomonas sp. T1.2MG-36]
MSRFAPTTATSYRSGVFRRTYETTLGTRERQAQRYVAPYLASLDDQSAREHGCGRASIGIMRSRAVDAAL